MVSFGPKIVFPIFLKDLMTTGHRGLSVNDFFCYFFVLHEECDVVAGQSQKILNFALLQDYF